MSNESNPAFLIAEAEAAMIAKIVELVDGVTEDSVEIQERNKSLANNGREVGLLLQGWCGHDQIKLSSYERLLEKLPEKTRERLTFAAATKCVKVSHRFTQAISTFKESGKAVQEMLQGFGFEPTPEREAQEANRMLPASEFFMVLGKARVRVEKVAKTSDKWTPETIAGIHREVRRHGEWLKEFSATLPPIPADPKLN